MWISDVLAMVEQDLGCVVSVQDVAGVLLQVPALQLRPEQQWHHGPYCEFVKRRGHQSDCQTHKRATLKRAAAQPEGFSAICPFGVWDYVQPVHHDGTLVATIYLGSLQGKALSVIDGHLYAGCPLRQPTAELCASIEASAKFMAEAMALAIRRWEAEGHALSKHKPADFYVEAVRVYVETNYSLPIQLRDVAEHLGMHPNYLGQIIRRECGLPFSSLLRDYRIQRAQTLLSVGSHTVTEVAYACGFNDGNYFSTTFKRVVGISPRVFMRQQVQSGS